MASLARFIRIIMVIVVRFVGRRISALRRGWRGKRIGSTLRPDVRRRVTNGNRRIGIATLGRAIGSRRFLGSARCMARCVGGGGWGGWFIPPERVHATADGGELPLDGFDRRIRFEFDELRFGHPARERSAERIAIRSVDSAAREDIRPSHRLQTPARAGGGFASLVQGLGERQPRIIHDNPLGRPVLHRPFTVAGQNEQDARSSSVGEMTSGWMAGVTHRSNEV